MSPRIQEIPLAAFDLSLSGMRIMNMNRIQQIEKSMRLHGQLQPVVARVHKDGYQLIDGFKRLYIAKGLMMETLQCQMLEIDLSQAKVLLMSYNRSHQSIEAWEDAMVLQDLQKTHSLNQRNLAKLTDHSRSWVSRRLSLIDKIDEKVSSEIMMGTLTSSHARALTRLPRGKQREVARVIATWRLSSRQSDTLVEIFLKAKDEDQQRYILEYPKKILMNDPADSEAELYDARLSCYGNELMQSTVNAIVGLQVLLFRLDDLRIGMFNETEKVIIPPFLREVSGYAEKLSEAIGQLQIHKSE